MSDKKEEGTTTVKTVDIADLDQLLGTPGAESVMVPESEKKQVEKPNIFTNKKVDLSFLEKDDDNDSSSPDAKTDFKKDDSVPEKLTKEDEEEILNQITADPDKPGGRPKMSKDAMLELAQRLIETNQIAPFQNEKGEDEDLTKYSVKDFEELFTANFKEKENKIRQQVPIEFFDSLPEEMQYAAKYIADGGKDLKGLFRTLAQVEEVRQLDPSEENDQEQIIRSYLNATNPDWTQDEIEEEIVGWKDRDELESKAKKFKPKLDAMQEQVIAQQLARQENLRKQQQQHAQAYMENIYQVLEPSEINGLKLDKKTQGLLYTGLVQANYPSVSGKQTNLLGHLLEKYQFVEPNHALVAEALWLLADPDGYRNKVKENGSKNTVEKTVRLLKTEEKNKIGSSAGSDIDADERASTRTRTGMQRPTGGFFKR